MSIEREIQKRSGSECELCTATEKLSIYNVPPNHENKLEKSIYACATCISQIEDAETMDANHWRCLNDSMWSEVKVVQIVAWRMLHRLKKEGWPQDLLDMMYFDEDDLSWAAATGEADDKENSIKHLDVNGVQLQAGDSVVLIKDLNVKGAGFVAKRGSAVRNITLTHDNAEHIEGRLNGQHIVIITKYVKKT
ncbi:PhnA domain-containing protein [Kordia sp. YSTF-M3]|uniref:PhnA domain-containing protein n=1 Tax=Kordia aestuariivivens TaxID=2759037 RepID=A0ABR7QGI4_9FLAO|nr:alkylphosphonate utilization protein [Kordia aestuariivivens]MBC8757687.1 PhnA domain-containing protein [Kordia aestuariivivens]